MRSLWPDKAVEKWTFKHTVKYDNLKEEYEITLEELNEVIRTKDFVEMKRLMVTGDAIELKTDRPLKADSRHTASDDGSVGYGKAAVPFKTYALFCKVLGL